MTRLPPGSLLSTRWGNFLRLMEGGVGHVVVEGTGRPTGARRCTPTPPTSCVHSTGGGRSGAQGVPLNSRESQRGGAPAEGFRAKGLWKESAPPADACSMSAACGRQQQRSTAGQGEGRVCWAGLGRAGCCALPTLLPQHHHHRARHEPAARHHRPQGQEGPSVGLPPQVGGVTHGPGVVRGEQQEGGGADFQGIACTCGAGNSRGRKNERGECVAHGAGHNRKEIEGEGCT